MTEGHVRYVDPWLKQNPPAARIPADGIFLCAYDVHVEILNMTEAAFLRRTCDADELWLAIEPSEQMLDDLSTPRRPLASEVARGGGG